MKTVSRLSRRASEIRSPGGSYLEFILQVITAFILIFFLATCDRRQNNPVDGNHRKLWETLLPSEIYYASPALSADEKTVYIGTSTWLTGIHGGPHYFVALDAATGIEHWRFSLGSKEVRSTPAVAADGSIYFTVELRDSITQTVLGDKLWHISADGDPLWAYNINPDGLTMEIGLTTPAIGSDGTVYVVGDSLYAIRSNGTRRWAVLGSPFPGLREMHRNAPVIGPDGTIYFASHNIPLTAFNPDDGSVIWSCTLGVNDHCLASPAIGPDGTIYVATNPGILYAVSSAGQIKWTFSISSVGFYGFFRSSPAVGGDSTIYFGLNYGSPSSAFFALNPNGTVKWIFEPTDLPADVPHDHFDIYSSPAIGSDSLIYFGQEFGRVYALHTAEGSVAWMEETKSGITWSSPAIAQNGSLFISDISGRVYAFETDSKGLDSTAAWPKFRYDNQNTGRKSQ